jgi:heat-inducible transcriptional repressor
MVAMELDRRKQQILAAAVRYYVATARPAGSEAIAERLGGRASSATIRNEMGALEEAGYLHQPHTSAGRVPTDLGYRFYVGSLMGRPALSERDRARLREWAREQTEVEPALDSSCRLLAEITHYPSLASAPAWTESRLARFELVQVGPRHVLAVAVATTGEVRHALMAVRRAPGDRLLRRLASLVSHLLEGRTVGEVDRQALRQATSRVGAADLLDQIVGVMEHDPGTTEGPRVFIQGAGRLLEQREFADVGRARALWALLEEAPAIGRMLPASGPDRVEITIGAENKHPALRECALVSSSYRLGDRPAGSVGILGPKRMHYERSVAAVELMASALSRALTRLARG